MCIRDSQDDAPEDSTDSSQNDEDTGEYSVEQLLALAQDAFNRADAALRTGDLAGYQSWVETASGYIARAQALVSESPQLDDADAA